MGSPDQPKRQCKRLSVSLYTAVGLCVSVQQFCSGRGVLVQIVEIEFASPVD